ncbi:MAG: DUF5343 domain-containing protein [Hyphomonadaceae bacterium]|nr:DUF5343 domain-containing protein [Hyphomonadaceae bacterium]
MLKQSPPVREPPSVTYEAFTRALRLFKQGGLPARVDRSVLSPRFGPKAQHVIAAFQFLGLADEKGTTCDSTRNLVASLDEAHWPQSLASVLRNAYAPIFEIDLTIATLHQLNEQFATSYGVRGEAARRTVFFFVSAARDAKMELSNYLFENSRIRGGRAEPSVKPKRAGKQAKPPESGSHAPLPSQVMDALVAKFPPFDPDWSDSVKEQWFVSFRDLMNRLTGAGG